MKPSNNVAKSPFVFGGGTDLTGIAAASVDFLSVTCSGRDESHGVTHMVQVANQALATALVSGEYDPIFLQDLFIVGIHHDVLDHKYVKPSGDLYHRLVEHLTNLLMDPEAGVSLTAAEEKAYSLIAMMDHVSFSKERDAREEKMEDAYWKGLGAYGTRLVRYVADADRLEALGQIGFNRCVEYTMMIQKKESPDAGVAEAVQNHAIEKLYRLVSEGYIKTPYAQHLGKLQTGILRRLVDDLVASFSV